MVVEDFLEEDPILRFGAARRDTDEFFCNFVLEKEEAREEENAWSEREDVDEMNMMMIVCVLCGFFFFSYRALLKFLCRVVS